MAENSYYETHWRDLAAPEIPATKLAAAERFLAPAIARLAAAKNWLCLDAGCGDGVHVAALARQAAAGAHRFAACDLAPAALVSARRRGAGSWRFFAADLVRMPLNEAAVDLVFSFGVLAYTQDPAAAFAELARVLRPGGWIGVWIYPPPAGLAGAAFRLARGLCRWSGPGVSRGLAHLVVPFLGFLPVASGVHLGNASWRQCAEVVFTNFLPDTLHFPGAEEVKAWFKTCGVEIVYEDGERPLTFWGRKRERER